MTNRDLSGLEVPLVHMNGTSKHDLLDQQLKASEALRSAIIALQAAMPHGRDYYPLGAQAVTIAREQHKSRIDRLNSVLEETAHLAMRISDQGRGR